MDLLVLGGTLFLGRHVVEVALARGHRVAVFNRGRTNPALHPEVERLRGDRGGDVSALEGRRFDAVVDCSGYTPGAVRATAERLDVESYVFVSTISVYADFSTGMDESAALAELPDGASEDEFSEAAYGALKGRCEAAVREVRSDGACVVRPGLIVGPWDPTDRFTYWVARAAQGGAFLAPDTDQPVQWIDVRDLARWLVQLGEERTQGTFNATGPEDPCSFARMLDEVVRATDSGARPVRAAAKFLNENGVTPWRDLPLWLPRTMHGMLDARCDRARSQGLELRPLQDTVRATLEWLRTDRGDAPLQAGLTPDRERDLLTHLRAAD